MKLVVILMLIMCLYQSNFSQAPDSCLKLYCPDNYDYTTSSGSLNPDNVLVDTCSSSATFDKIFAKRYFFIQFKQYYYPFDTVLKPDSIQGVEDISESKPLLKQQLEQLENEFGTFYIQGHEYEETDSVERFNPVLRIFFEDYQDIDYVLERFKEVLDSTKLFVYSNRIVILCNTPSDIALKPETKESDIYLSYKKSWNPYIPGYNTDDFYPTNFHPLGFESNIYQIKCPMAWEITLGAPNTVIGIFRDEFRNSSQHPEVYNNFIKTTTRGLGANITGNLGVGHGLACLSNAVAGYDNGNPMVGTAPECKGVNVRENLITYDLFDNDNLLTYPDVKSRSSFSIERRDDIDAGVVVVGSAGNGRADLSNAHDMVRSYITPEFTNAIMVSSQEPGRSIFSEPMDNTNGNLDIKVICVGATQSGTLFNKYCQPWEPPNDFIGPNFRNGIQFCDNWNFSPGISKFNNNSSSAIRLQEKREAYIDIVAPGRGILCAAEGLGYDNNCDNSFQIGSDNWFVCRTGKIPTQWTIVDMSSTNVRNAIQDARKYNFWSGTSHSAPTVAGIVGLMVSVNKFMGVPLVNSLPSSEVWGRNVQRRTYNILTFTADKINDWMNWDDTTLFYRNFESIVNLHNCTVNISTLKAMHNIVINNTTFVGAPLYDHSYMQAGSDPNHIYPNIESYPYGRIDFTISGFSASGGPQEPFFLKVIADYNVNETIIVFDENIYTSSSSSTVHQFSYSVPQNVNKERIRLRIIASANNTDQGFVTGCGDISEGQVYDFKLNTARYYYASTFEDGRPFQLQYETQWNDNLKRSWAQRMGFGLVNAYRAVAHSIRQKGAYEYSTSGYINLLNQDVNGDSRGYINPVGTRLMHWGGIVNEGIRPFELQNWRGPTYGNDDTLLVLEWGGASLPGEFHNNMGVTRLNSHSEQKVELTVPSHAILAIDGILVSDEPERSHVVKSYLIGMTETSKILMEGWLQDVEIFGNLRIGDLTVVSTTEHLSGCIGIGNTADISEIYGKVTLKEHAMLYSWGLCKFKPGSYVDMQGTKDIILNDNSNTFLEYGTTITGLPGRKIVVKNGAILNIDSKAKVDLLCEVLVESGGTLIINSDAVVRANRITIQKDADFMMFDGSTLALDAPEQFWDGRVIINGGPDNFTQIIGMLKETCLPIDDPNYTEFDNIYTAPTIYMKGSCTEPTKSVLHLIYARFKNISVETHDFPIIPALNSEFLSNTRITNPYLNFKSLLSVYYDNCQDCNRSEYKTFDMQGCIFQDVSGYEPHPSEPDNWNRRIYRTGGLMITGIEDVDIRTSKFLGLEYGVATYDCGDVKISDSEFSFSGIGDYDFGSTTTLCDNHYLEVQFGSVRDHSLIGKAFDNWYWLSRIGFSVMASTQQRFRGNHFQEYLMGIRSSCSEIVLNNYDEYPYTWIYGMNLFEISQFPSGNPPDLSLYYNNFITKENCEPQLTCDIDLVKQCCSLLMTGGHNGMSEFTWDHIRYEGPGFFPNTIEVSYNSFPSWNWPRTYQVNTTHISNTLGPEQYIYSPPDCGDRNVIQKADTTNDGNDNNYSLALFMKALDDYDSRSLQQSYNSALRCSLPGNKLLTIDSLLSMYPVNGNDDFSDNLSIIKADLAYRLGDKEKSLKFLSDVEDGSGSLLRLKAGEDTQGATASGLLSFVEAAVDVKCSNTQTAVDEAITGLELNLEQNRPNPFSDFTDIGFTLSSQSAVTLIVSDIYGNKICTLLDNAILPPGRHSAAFNTDGISSGVYVYTLFADGAALSKRMQLVK